MEFLKGIEKKVNNAFYKLLKVIFGNKKVPQIKDPNNIKRVLFLRYDVLGDMITTYPAIKLVKRINPDIIVDVLASPKNSFLIKDDPSIDNIYHYNRKLLSSIFKLRKLSKNNYDIIFAAYYLELTKNGLLAQLLSKEGTIKSNVYDSEKRYVMFNYQSKIARSKQNMFEKMFYLVADTFGSSQQLAGSAMEIPQNKISAEAVKEFLQDNNLLNYTVLNISAGREINQWPHKKWIELLQKLTEKFPDMNFVVVSMPADFGKAEDLSKISDKVNAFPADKDIFKTIELIKQADYVITPDTAIVHICSVFKKPVTVLINPNNLVEKVWVPYKTKYRLAVSESDENLWDITPAAVFEKYNSLVNEK